MKALVYQGPGKKAWQDVPPARIQHPTDVIVRIDTTTICATDLHILKGDVPAVTPGSILGHEGTASLRLVAEGRLDVDKFISHHFKLDDLMTAYEVFGRAAETKALKVIIER